MFRKCSYSRPSRVGRNQLVLEFLEHRRLLAGDFQPGDSNQDYHFDEADFVHSMKLGTYESGKATDWAGGDWNKDGQFTSGDLVAAFIKGLYHSGPYDSEAGPAVNTLAPLSVTGQADVSIYYTPEDGSLIAVGPAGMTVLHLVSRSGSFADNRGPGLYDVGTASSQFNFEPNGRTWIEHSSLLPTGWSDQQVLDDLLIDGAVRGGGGLGNVRLGALADLPEERPFDALRTGKRPGVGSFVAPNAANGTLTYDPATGDIRIEGINRNITTLELVSGAGHFTGTVGAGNRYTVGLFDVANTHKVFRLDPRGMPRIDLPGVARTGLSSQEFAIDVQPNGSLAGGGPLRLSLVVAPLPLTSECDKQLFGGATLGDTNLDGRFNSEDLVAIFQAGEYEDGTTGNSTWSEGDWTCDGDFDSRDLVAAFQTGKFDLAAAAVAAQVRERAEMVSSDADDSVQTMDEPIFQSAPMYRGRKNVSVPTMFKSRRVSDDVSRLQEATDEVMTDFKFLA